MPDATYGIVAIPNDYVSDWSQGHGREWAEVSPYDTSNLTLYTPNPPVGTFVNGEWVARYSHASGYGKIQTMPRFVLSARHNFEVEVPITINALPVQPAAGVRTLYFSVVLYNGEASYFGAYFTIERYPDGALQQEYPQYPWWTPYPEGVTTRQGMIYVHNCGYGGFEWNESETPYLGHPVTGEPGWWELNDKVYVKIVNDVTSGQTRLYVRNETRDPGGAYSLLHTRYHETILDGDPRVKKIETFQEYDEEGNLVGVTGGESNFRWLEPCSLWISGSPFGDSVIEQPWNIDLHPIHINQDGPAVLAGAGSYYPWSRYWNPLTTGFNSWPTGLPILTESVEANHYPEGLYGGTVAENEPYVLTMSGGVVDVISPLIGGNGYAPTTVRLYGKQATGTVKVQVLDESQQVVTVGGVSEWYVDGGAFSPVEIDVSAANLTHMYLRFYLDGSGQSYEVNHTGGWQYPEVSPILYGFVVTGTPPPPPEASPHGGRFPTGQTVNINSLDGMTVIYTLDGSDPRSYILMNPEGRAIFNPDGDVITTGG